MNDFDSKRGSFILENHQPNVEEKKTDAFFVPFSFVVLKRHFCEPFVSFL